MPEIETLRDAWNHGVKITMRCAWGPYQGMKRKRECEYSVELDLETLVVTRGPNFPISRLSDRLICPRCMSRRVRILLSFPTNENVAKAQTVRRGYRE